jgi:hypothetical protein
LEIAVVSVTAVDGGMNWSADASVIVSEAREYFTRNVAILSGRQCGPGDCSNRHFLTQERWDYPSGAEMGLEVWQWGAKPAPMWCVSLPWQRDGLLSPARQFDVSIENQLFLDDILTAPQALVTKLAACSNG